MKTELRDLFYKFKLRLLFILVLYASMTRNLIFLIININLVSELSHVSN